MENDETLWHDVVLKSLGNGRGLVAYGIALMDKGEFASAIDYFRRAQQLTPQNHVLFINLAIAENETEQSAAAEQHFKEALRLAPWSANSYIYYARYLLSHSRVDEARMLLRSAPDSSPNDVTTRELLKETEAMARDSGLFGLPRAPIGQALNSPGPQTTEFYLALSAQFYREGRYVESISPAGARSIFDPATPKHGTTSAPLAISSAATRKRPPLASRRCSTSRTSNWRGSICNTRVKKQRRREDRQTAR